MQKRMTNPFIYVYVRTRTANYSPSLASRRWSSLSRRRRLAMADPDQYAIAARCIKLIPVFTEPARAPITYLYVATTSSSSVEFQQEKDSFYS